MLNAFSQSAPLSIPARIYIEISSHRMDMFFHIASIEREVYWQLGNVVCSAYPLRNLDTIHSEVNISTPEYMAGLT